MFGLQLLKSSHAYRIGSLQIYQNDCFSGTTFSTHQDRLASVFINYRPEVSATAKRWGLSSPKAAPLYCCIIWTSYKCGNLRKGFTAIKIFPVYVCKEQV
ncbi:hypothetical protein ACJIZ3_007617 [Penstemon smallii]|uniref:Uncharacterized protein n=1 Tax=Penstemon smallii TaxID=265156 RepID=A0ABD3T7G1_9LAMI